MNNSSGDKSVWRRMTVPLASITVLVAGFLIWPVIKDQLPWSQSTAATEHEGDQPHAHDHGHDELPTLHLSDQARRNIGLTDDLIQPVRLTTYRRSLDIPGILVEQPGCAHVNISTPMTGILTRVGATVGEAVVPGALLFEMRLTHEDLVKTQVEFVRTLGELDVELKELERLREASQLGAIAGKSFLEKEYARDRLQALLQAQRESLRLHGLSSRQVDRIAEDRRLLQDLQIVVPKLDGHQHAAELKLSGSETPPITLASHSGDPPTPLVVEELTAHTGQAVQAGATLCTLVQLEQLYVEGLAFEHDSQFIMRALENDWPVEAVMDSGGTSESSLSDLRIEFVASDIDIESRILKFYLPVRNEILRDTTDASGRRYVIWKHRPGQRLTLRVPVEEFEQQIVVPVDAVAIEAAEAYVFRQNGDHFDQVPVHVLHRDRHRIVIANDGSVFPGDVIAMGSAHQIQMAIRNQAGGGIDPHAGHTH